MSGPTLGTTVLTTAFVKELTYRRTRSLVQLTICDAKSTLAIQRVLIRPNVAKVPAQPPPDRPTTAATAFTAHSVFPIQVLTGTSMSSSSRAHWTTCKTRELASAKFGSPIRPSNFATHLIFSAGACQKLVLLNNIRQYVFFYPSCNFILHKQHP